MKYERKDAAHGHEQSVDAHPEDYPWNEWPVYPEYELGGHEGYRFVYSPIRECEELTESEEQLRGTRRYRPLSRQTAALFLEFARWPEEEEMDLEPLGSRRNEAAALEWAGVNGVLGLDSSSQFEIFGEASEAIQHSLGIWGAVRPRTRNEGYGGPKETVEAFAREAWLANMTLRLYEAATQPEGPDLEAIVAYMPNRESLGDDPRNVRKPRGLSPEHARGWALSIVEEIVEDRLRGHVWPVPVKELGGRSDFVGHEQGWAFDSLLGAMWLQMMWLMLSRVRRCEWCGRLLDVDPEQGQGSQTARIADGRRKPRNDRRFCPSSGGVKNKCKADWNYHRGTGKSSKEARRRAWQGS
jgi:hypothetical protein